MNAEQLTLEIELQALNDLFNLNEQDGRSSDDIRDAINERRVAIRQYIARQRVEQMLIEHLDLEFPEPPQQEQLPFEVVE